MRIREKCVVEGCEWRGMTTKQGAESMATLDQRSEESRIHLITHYDPALGDHQVWSGKFKQYEYVE